MGTVSPALTPHPPPHLAEDNTEKSNIDSVSAVVADLLLRQLIESWDTCWYLVSSQRVLSTLSPSTVSVSPADYSPLSSPNCRRTRRSSALVVQ